MIKREAEVTVKKLAEGYPVVIVTGPRQSGKTTLAKSAFFHKEYVSLENLDMRRFAIDDPGLFLNRFPHGAILDEVQYCPDLLSYMQEKIDFSRDTGISVRESVNPRNSTSMIQARPLHPIHSKVSTGGSSLPVRTDHILYMAETALTKGPALR
ncbi:MAG: AAA family ATPase [Candidatus Fermentibacteria bacterium]|nr:AAA family ATPase [Candidatus Fermentibacteria bacterium]